MTVTFSPAPKPQPTVKPPKALRKRNAARQKSEFQRTCHSHARQKFVRLGPCSACGIWGPCESAHVLGNDGGSRKGPYTSTAPLCTVRPGNDLPDVVDHNGLYEGCHGWSHRDPQSFAARFPKFNPRKAARDTQRRWLAFVRGEANPAPEREPSNGL